MVSKTSRNPTGPSGSFSYKHHRLFTSYVQGALTAICLQTCYVFAVPMEEN